MRKAPPKWEPTEEQYARYKTRDLELAKSNASLIRQSSGSSHDSLHSRATMHEAWQAALVT